MKLNIQNSTLFITAGKLSQFPRDAIPQIALSGRSNVGKSSLINSLLGRKSLARVSSTPGKTVTVNFYSVDKKLFLVDLPGYGYAKRYSEDKRVWSNLTDGFFTQRDNTFDLLKGVIQLVDMKTGPTSDDDMMLNWLNAMNIPYFIVATKSDKLNATQKASQLEKIKNDPYIRKDTKIIAFSALKNEGKDDIWNTILSLCD